MRILVVGQVGAVGGVVLIQWVSEEIVVFSFILLFFKKKFHLFVFDTSFV